MALRTVVFTNRIETLTRKLINAKRIHNKLMERSIRKDLAVHEQRILSGKYEVATSSQYIKIKF